MQGIGTEGFRFLRFGVREGAPLSTRVYSLFMSKEKSLEIKARGAGV